MKSSTLLLEDGAPASRRAAAGEEKMFARLARSLRGSIQAQGIFATLASAAVLGLTPIFGKEAILAGVSPLTVVMLRSSLAALTLWLAYLSVAQWRRLVFIYPAGLLGCVAAGVINGLGSVFYYLGLVRLDASLAQLLFMLHPIFLAPLSRLNGDTLSVLTLFRLGLAMAAVALLTAGGHKPVDWISVALVIVAGLMYAFHLVLNQRVLYDMPSPTVALYTLTAMALTVGGVYCAGGFPALPAGNAAWRFVLLLAGVTLASRLLLFIGVKRIGSVQTALLGVSELLVTIVAALLWLNEKLTPAQWLGAALLAVSIMFVSGEKNLGNLPPPRPWLQIFTTWLARFFTPKPSVDFAVPDPPLPPDKAAPRR